VAEALIYIAGAGAALLAGDYGGRALFRAGIPDEYVFPVLLVAGVLGFWSGLFLTHTAALLAFALFTFALVHQIADQWRNEARRLKNENKRLSYALDAEKRRVERLRKHPDKSG
jgi:hypothetical protein